MKKLIAQIRLWIYEAECVWNGGKLREQQWESVWWLRKFINKK